MGPGVSPSSPPVGRPRRHSCRSIDADCRQRRHPLRRDPRGGLHLAGQDLPRSPATSDWAKGAGDHRGGRPGRPRRPPPRPLPRRNEPRGHRRCSIDDVAVGRYRPRPSAASRWPTTSGSPSPLPRCGPAPSATERSDVYSLGKILEASLGNVDRRRAPVGPPPHHVVELRHPGSQAAVRPRVRQHPGRGDGRRPQDLQPGLHPDRRDHRSRVDGIGDGGRPRPERRVGVRHAGRCGRCRPRRRRRGRGLPARS